MFDHVTKLNDSIGGDGGAVIGAAVVVVVDVVVVGVVVLRVAGVVRCGDKVVFVGVLCTVVEVALFSAGVILVTVTGAVVLLGVAFVGAWVTLLAGGVFAVVVVGRAGICVGFAGAAIAGAGALAVDETDAGVVAFKRLSVGSAVAVAGRTF